MCGGQNSVANQEKKINNPVLNPHPNVSDLQTIDYFLYTTDEFEIFGFLPLTPRDSLEEGSASFDALFLERHANLTGDLAGICWNTISAALQARKAVRSASSWRTIPL